MSQLQNFKMRIAILENKIQADGIKIPKEVIEYLAYSITSNIRELKGALITIYAHSAFNKKTITLDFANQ